MAAQTSTRKQWRLCRGPKGNVQSLGWAEFGCPDSQVKLAKELLQDNGEDVEEREEKARLGVYWLLKASEKGHAEATSLLAHCLTNRIGITEQNLSDVKVCLEMPMGEKLSREAAKELFLSLAQGENYITSNQLIKEISKFSEGSSTASTGRVGDWIEGRGVRLSEEEMVIGGSQHLHGELPPILGEELRTRGEGPVLAYITAKMASLPFLPPPALAISLLALVGPLYLLDSLPSVLYYCSLALMLISTTKILNNNSQFRHFKGWSEALVARGCSEEVSSEAQWSHCSARSTSFLIFFSSLFAHLIISSSVPTPPYSEIATLSTLLSLYVLYNFAWDKKKVDILAVVVFIVYLVARYPYEVDTLVYHYWRYLDVHVPTFTSYALGSSIEFCLNVRVVLYLMLPGLLLKMASRRQWLGIYTSLLPILVSLAWSQLALSASKGASEFGVSRSVLGVVLTGILLPLSSASLLLLPIIAISKFFITHQLSARFALASFSLLTAIYLTFRYRAWRRTLRFILIVMSIASIFALASWGETESWRETRRRLDWREVSAICSRKDLASDELCATLTGLEVTGKGHVLSARVATLHNPALSLILRLPTNLQGAALCFFGEKYESCRNGEDCEDRWNNCRISNWNKYEYEVELETESTETEEVGGAWGVGGQRPRPINVRLRAGPAFRNFSISLAYGDYISFTGMVFEDDRRQRDGYQPLMRVTEASCIECANPGQIYRSTSMDNVLRSFTSTLFNFIFYPLAVFNFSSNPQNGS